MPLIALMLQKIGWRASFLGLAAASLALIPLVLMLLAKRASALADAAPRPPIGADIRFLLREPVFHLLFWRFLLCGYTTTGVIETHLMPYAAFCGFPPLPSATAYGLLSLVNLSGMVLAGYLADKVHRPSLLGAIYIIRAATFLLLMNIGADYQTLLLFAIVFGIVDYSTVPITASLAASHLGVRIMGLAMGLISAGHAAGGAAGAFLGGYLFDRLGTYDRLWVTSIIAAGIAGVAALLIPSSERLKDEPTGAKA